MATAPATPTARDPGWEKAWREDAAERMAKVVELAWLPMDPDAGREAHRRQVLQQLTAGLAGVPVEHLAEMAEWMWIHMTTQLGALRMAAPAARK